VKVTVAVVLRGWASMLREFFGGRGEQLRLGVRPLTSEGHGCSHVEGLGEHVERLGEHVERDSLADEMSSWDWGLGR